MAVTTRSLRRPVSRVANGRSSAKGMSSRLFRSHCRHLNADRSPFLKANIDLAGPGVDRVFGPAPSGAGQGALQPLRRDPDLIRPYLESLLIDILRSSQRPCQAHRFLGEKPSLFSMTAQLDCRWINCRSTAASRNYRQQNMLKLCQVPSQDLAIDSAC